MMEPVAIFHSPFNSKFGIPRQSGIVNELEGYITFTPSWQTPDAIRGLEGFNYIWLLWGFSANKQNNVHTTVRPPLLGGNKRMGVFATRSPFRPNGIGLSSVKISRIENTTNQGPIIYVEGADLMDGTPIYDIKPYLPFTDCHPDAKGGFTDEKEWQKLKVKFTEKALKSCPFTAEELTTLQHILELDPRPHFQDEEGRIYGMPYQGKDIKFEVKDGILEVLGIENL